MKTDRYLRVHGTNGSVFALGDAATVSQVQPIFRTFSSSYLHVFIQTGKNRPFDFALLSQLFLQKLFQEKVAAAERGARKYSSGHCAHKSFLPKIMLINRNLSVLKLQIDSILRTQLTVSASSSPCRYISSYTARLYPAELDRKGFLGVISVPMLKGV